MELKKNTLHKALSGFSLLLFIIAVIMIAGGKLAHTGPLLISGFILLSIGVRGFDATKGLSYTILIFTAVTASLFYPQYFTSIGNFKLSLLIVPLLQIIMFGMGSQMSLNDFIGIVKMPKGVIIGVIAHFLIMPLVAFGITRIFNFPPEIAAGILLIGCVPSGLASNVMCYIARANLPLSVTIGAIGTILSPVLTPVLMKQLAGQFIEINVWNMMLDILNMIILPIIAGFIFNMFYSGKTNRKAKIIQTVCYAAIILLTSIISMISGQSGWNGLLLTFTRSLTWFCLAPTAVSLLLKFILKGNRKVIEQILSFFSMAGIAVIITIITGAGRDSLLNVGALLLVTSLIHNLSGYTLGYGLSWLFGMKEKDRRTIALEVGMQNGGLASGLAVQMGKIATVGLAPAIFGPLMNVTGSVLASWWRGKLPPEDCK
jgi:BASS family bile acid:Na+ symporter